MGAVTFLELVHQRSVSGDYSLTWCPMMPGTMLLDEGNIQRLFAYVGYGFFICWIRILCTLYRFFISVVVDFRNTLPVE